MPQFTIKNVSTNEIMDPHYLSNNTFEQSIEELRSYISLVGISLSQGLVLYIYLVMIRI